MKRTAIAVLALLSAATLGLTLQEPPDIVYSRCLEVTDQGTQVDSYGNVPFFIKDIVIAYEDGASADARVEFLDGDKCVLAVRFDQRSLHFGGGVPYGPGKTRVICRGAKKCRVTIVGWLDPSMITD